MHKPPLPSPIFGSSAASVNLHGCPISSSYVKQKSVICGKDRGGVRVTHPEDRWVRSPPTPIFCQISIMGAFTTLLFPRIFNLPTALIRSHASGGQILWWLGKRRRLKSDHLPGLVSKIELRPCVRKHAMCGRTCACENRSETDWTHNLSKYTNLRTRCVRCACDQKIGRKSNFG